MVQLGIDIGGTSVKVAVQQDGLPLRTAQSREYIRPDTASLAAAIGEAARCSAATVPTSIGLCVPGLLDATGECVAISSNVPGLVGVPLWKLIADALGMPLPPCRRIVNDAFAAASDIVALRRLSGRVLVLSLGTGVGGSILDDGRLLLVEGGSPGHLGQVDVSLDSDPPIAPDEGAGGVEGYLGAGALRRRYGDVATALARMTADDPPIRALVRLIRIVHAIYRPQHVVLAGGIGLRLARLLPDIRAAVAAKLTNIARDGWTLTIADHDFHAACGAAELSRGQLTRGDSTIAAV